MAKRPRVEGVYQRPESRYWWIAFTHPKTGKQIRVSSKTTIQEKAKQLYARLYNEAFDQANFKASVTKTVREIMDWHWKTNLASRPRPPLKKNYDSLIKRGLEIFGDVVASDLSVQVIKEFVGRRFAEGVIKSTVNHEIQPFNTAFNQAIKTDGMLSRNPFREIEKYNCSDLKRDRIATPRERQALITESSGMLQKIIIFAFNSGMRCGQIRNLKWTDINFSERKMKTMSEKGRGGTQIYQVPIFNAALDVLLGLPRDSQWVFPGPFGEQIPRYGLIHAGFPRLTKKLGIEDFHFHDIRHSFATEFYRKHKNIKAIQKILGHTTSKQTETYLNLKDEDLIPNGDFDVFPSVFITAKNVIENVESQNTQNQVF